MQEKIETKTIYFVFKFNLHVSLFHRTDITCITSNSPAWFGDFPLCFTASFANAMQMVALGYVLRSR